MMKIEAGDTVYLPSDKKTYRVKSVWSSNVGPDEIHLEGKQDWVSAESVVKIRGSH